MSTAGQGSASASLAGAHPMPKTPAHEPSVLSLGSPSFSIFVLKTNELEKYLVVAARAEMWLRMHGVP